MKILLFIFLIDSFSLAQPVEYPSQREQRQSRRANSIGKLRQLWAPKYLSDVSKHKPHNFLYIVHEIDTGAYEYTIPYLENPERINQQYKVSGSVINQDFLGTYSGRIALILNVPKNHIGPMHWMDMASTRTNSYNNSIRHFNGLSRRFKTFYSPRQLVETTKQKRSSYNEVVFLGVNEYHQTKISVAGIMVQCRDTSILKEQNSALLDIVNSPEELELLKNCLLSDVPPKYLNIRNHHLLYLKRLAQNYPVLIMREEGYRSKY